MRKAIVASILLVLAASTGVLLRAAEPAARISVRADKPGPQVSPVLFGIFFEEINCAGDGGLYAELVRNRSFEDSEKPAHWTLVESGSCKGEISLVEDVNPRSEHNRRALRIAVVGGGEGRAGVANEGYWGIPVQAGETYDLSILARGEGGFTGPLAATIEGSGRKVLAEGKIGALSAEWKEHRIALPAGGADPKARLVISASSPGVFWLDLASLFPRKTWKGRPNGLRPDIAEMLDGLQPSFVRFPGGCWVEGDTLQFAQRWKTTVGPIAERRTQYNIWQYMSTNGLGYHEYLQMCEDLGAEPLFVINCGMSHRENVPMDRMDPWVQDALDAIEYANGPAESAWGALRAKNGHPAPFGLEYIEIGNENGGPAYQERYALFYDAIRARYPALKIIADVPTEKRPADIVDEHYYSSPEFFISNAFRYDSYDRKGPKIYVGEYAVTAGSGAGNLIAAVGEAAFMTGIERNSDHVVMASYAPLFANVNYKKWNPDLINFDGTRVYGTPSYHVQKMFSRNRGDAILPAEIEGAAPAEPVVKKGGIGLGTWFTQAEFKDVKVTKGGATLFESDFSRGIAGWKVYKGDWKVKDGCLQQTAAAEDLRITAGDPGWSDYTLSLKARKLSGSEGFLILFQVVDDLNWVWWNLGGWGNVRHAIEVCSGGGKSVLENGVPGKIETGRWYDIRIELEGARIRCFLDGKLVHDISVKPAKALYASATKVLATGEVILKAVNVTAKALEARIDLVGAGAVEPAAKAIVLTSASPADENTLEEPLKVAPKEKEIGGAAASFRHEFPGYSVTVLRIKTKAGPAR